MGVFRLTGTGEAGRAAARLPRARAGRETVALAGRPSPVQLQARQPLGATQALRVVTVAFYAQTRRWQTVANSQQSQDAFLFKRLFFFFFLIRRRIVFDKV